MELETILVAIAGFVGGLVSTLASNGSSATLPALELFGLSEHVANGTNRLSVAALVLLTGCDLREGNAMKAFILLIVGLQSVLIFGESGEVNWAAGVALALGSAVGAYVAARLVARARAKVWVYRFLVIVVVLSIVHLIMVDSTKFLQHA